MSSLPNALFEEITTARTTPKSRVLLLAHSDYAKPMARYLRRHGYDVTVPVLKDNTAEECAGLLFPPRESAPATHTETRWRFPWRSKNQGQTLPDVGPPTFFAWNAFDAVVMQDLWPSREDGRMIPFGCMVVSDDYYARGNFHQPKVLLVTDPGFYKTTPGGRSYDEMLRASFDRNEQISFVPLVSTTSTNSLSRLTSALKRRNGIRRSERIELPTESSAPEQALALSVIKKALADYIRSCAHVVLVDDSPFIVEAVAAQFEKNVAVKEKGRVHFCDVTAGTVVSHASFDELRRDCEQTVESARRAGELLIIITDILFDAVEWDGGRKTGIDLIAALRSPQRGQEGKVGIIGLTGVGSPLVMTSAFHRGADAMVSKSPRHGIAASHHATGVNELVMYKLLLTMASLCFQHEFLRAKRHVPVDRARAESFAMRRILPSHAVSPHMQAEWEATQYLLEAQATYAQSPSGPAERVISRIREQYD